MEIDLGMEAAKRPNEKEGACVPESVCSRVAESASAA